MSNKLYKGDGSSELLDKDLVAPNGYPVVTPQSIVDALTADADAAAGDVLDGKFVYVDGEKVEGTLALTGNATEADVIAGKTFYSNDAKTKKTGTSTAVETGDATAVAADIALGKTAYVNGELITGTHE